MPEDRVEHNWRDSTNEIGLVGTLYGSIYPWICHKCGSLRHSGDHIISQSDKPCNSDTVMNTKAYYQQK